MSLVFYDFEVFKHDWLVVFIEPMTRQKTVIVNNTEEFKEFYDSHKGDIWIGYNSKMYDQYIAKAILCGFNPYEVNEWIITKGKQGWAFSDLFRRFPIFNFDVSTGFHSLKQLEAFMGNDIRETSVPFSISRPLTEEEIQETVKYCTHDVEQTIEVFLHSYEMFESQIGLIKAFDLPLSCVSKTQTQLTARILGAARRSYNDEFDALIPSTLQLTEKYQNVVEFFRNAKEDTIAEMKERTRYLTEDIPPLLEEAKRLLKASKTKTQRDEYEQKIKNLKKELKTLPAADWTNPEAYRKWFYSRKLETEVSCVPHVFAWGGVHGAIEKYIDTGRFIMADVASLYPSLMIRYEYFSRSITDPQKYVQIYEQNLEMKKTKDPRRPAYKLICNKTYGALKAETNPLYDPQMANNICVAGQLLLLDLIEKLEGVCKLIQSNTDGILVKIDSDEEYDEFCRIVKEWETRTGLVMEFSEFDRLFQGDVNNYIIVKGDDIKSKGAYVKKLSDIDNDLPIVNRAITEYLLNGIHPKETIMSCDSMKDFQKVVKVSSKYLYAIHNGRRLPEKTFRVFASTRKSDGTLYKVKEGEKPEKFANTPEKCFIENRAVNGVKCPTHLDKGYYVWLAKYRLLDKFGVDLFEIGESRKTYYARSGGLSDH